MARCSLAMTVASLRPVRLRLVPTPRCALEHFAGGALLPRARQRALPTSSSPALQPRAPAEDFPAWIRSIRQQKEQRSAGRIAKPRQAGIRAGWAAGVTTVADTGDSGAVIEALAELNASGQPTRRFLAPTGTGCHQPEAARVGSNGSNRSPVNGCVLASRPRAIHGKRAALSPYRGAG
jgi:hypothetical protein